LCSAAFTHQKKDKEKAMTTNQKIKIEKVEDHLYHKYSTEHSPQNTFIELDPEERILSAYSDGEIGNAVPMNVWNGRIRRYSLPDPYLTAETINWLMEKIEPLTERVVDGYECTWDGSNNVGNLDEDAAKAENEIDELLEMERLDETDKIAVWSAGDLWCESINNDCDEVDLIENVDSFINDLRGEYAELQEEETEEAI
jgi:hypothetical protein